MGRQRRPAAGFVNREGAGTVMVRRRPPARANQAQAHQQISAVTGDGRSVEVFNAAGDAGTTAMFDAASKTVLGKQHYRLNWSRDGTEVAVELRIVSVVQPNGGANDSLGLTLPLTVAGAAPTTDSGISGAAATSSEAP